MQQCLPLFRAHVGVLIAKHELDSVEKVRFAWPVTPHDDVMACAERLCYRLLLIGPETLDDNLAVEKEVQANNSCNIVSM